MGWPMPMHPGSGFGARAREKPRPGARRNGPRLEGRMSEENIFRPVGMVPPPVWEVWESLG